MKNFKLIFKTSPASTVITALSALVGGLILSFLSFSTERIIHFISAGDSSGVMLFLGILLGVYFIDAVLKSLNQIALNAGVFERTNIKLRELLALKLTRIQVVNFDSPEFKDKLSMAKRSLDYEEISMSYMEFLKILEALVSVLLVSGLLYFYHPILFIAAFVSAAPVLISRIIRGKSFARLRQKRAQDERRADAYIDWSSSANFAREIGVFGAEDFIHSKWQKLDKKMQSEILKFKTRDQAEFAGLEILKVLGVFAAVIFILHLVSTGQISLAIAAGALIAFTKLQQIVFDLFSSMGRLGYYKEVSQNLYHVLQLREQDYAGPQMDLGEFSFSYPAAERAAISGSDLSLEDGKLYAFVGENGAGKTTLSKIIMGLYHKNQYGAEEKSPVGTRKSEADTGKSLDSLDSGDSVSYIPQVIPKLNLTIREYLQLGLQTDRSDSDLQQLLQNHGLPQLADNLDSSLVKELGGMELSGGQWQRLSIAAAFLKDSKFYVFDEPTSAIDPLFENEILKMVISHLKGKTGIVITHRLAITPHLDSIIMINQGKIIESGSHRELMDAGGSYSEFYRLQS